MKKIKNIVEAVKRLASPKIVSNYYTDKPLGYISGHYELTEVCNVTHLYAQKMHFYCPADRKLNAHDLEEVDYKVFDKKFVMSNYGVIYICDEIMIVEDARFYEDKHFNEYLEETNPYEDSSWGGIDLYCIRCGSKLDELDKNKKGAWEYMRVTGVLQYYCSNKDCCHHTGMLTFHHPASEDRKSVV